MSDTLHKIYGRMLNSAQFSFGILHLGLPDEAYRMADATLQKFRKKGWATFERKGRHFVWTLTEEGREHITSVLSKEQGGDA